MEKKLSEEVTKSREVLVRYRTKGQSLFKVFYVLYLLGSLLSCPLLEYAPVHLFIVWVLLIPILTILFFTVGVTKKRIEERSLVIRKRQDLFLVDRFSLNGENNFVVERDSRLVPITIKPNELVFDTIENEFWEENVYHYYEYDKEATPGYHSSIEGYFDGQNEGWHSKEVILHAPKELINL